jgi:hypothetical protein
MKKRNQGRFPQHRNDRAPSQSCDAELAPLSPPADPVFAPLSPLADPVIAAIARLSPFTQ